MEHASSFNVNTFDAVVIGILVLSAIVAFFRGFIRELLSLGAWVGAALITVYLFPHSNAFMKNHIHGSQSAPVAAGVGALGTYIAALLFISLINSVILRYVKTGAEVGLLDNFLGLIFGALRGAFTIALGYLILMSVIPKDPPPEWMKNSLTRPYVEQCANLLASAAPTYLHDIEGFVKREEEKAKESRKQDNGYNNGGSPRGNYYPDGTPVNPPQNNQYISPGPINPSQ
jgi:membrane protein required for colicin V production